jgi:glycosyltransferase involved in cell wall biosynthesis
MNGGGAERVMIHLLNGMDRERFDLTLGLAQRTGPFLSLIPADVPVVDFQAKQSILSVPKLVRLFRSGGFDLCFSMIAMNFAAVLARAISGARLPLVLGARNHYSRSLPAEAVNAPIRALAVRALYPRAEMVIGVAQGVCDDLAAHFGIPIRKLRAIHNPLDLAVIRGAAALPAPHPWLAPDAALPVVLNVGKLQIAKGQTDLLRAFRHVRDRVPARLMILGRGPLQGELEALVRQLHLQEDVALVGFQDNPYAFMARASVFVLSSIWEGFPNVLAEAMACGAAVVSTDCPSGPSEIISSGDNGLLCPVAEPERLAASILQLLEDGELRQRLAKRGREDAARFDAQAIVSRYVDCFREVLSPLSPDRLQTGLQLTPERRSS